MHKRYTTLLLTILSLILFGCGGGSSSSTSSNPIVPTDGNLSLSSEPYYYQQWALDYNDSFYQAYNINPDAHIHAHDALSRWGGSGVTIAVIDDALDTTHPEFKFLQLTTYDQASRTSNVSPRSSEEFHGTAVTGIIASAVNNKGLRGIAPYARYIFIRYSQFSTDSDLIEMFNYAANHGADIINCSWGTYNVSPAVKQVIQDLAHNGRNGKGIIIVFASGNDNQTMGNDESAIPEVIAVGSSDIDNLRAWYSNYGEHLDIIAPGGYDIGITTTDIEGSDGYGETDPNYLLATDFYNFAGTSASAPIVSGIIALMLQKNPNLTREEVESILRNTADKIGDLPYENGRNDYYGYGKINVANIMQAI